MSARRSAATSGVQEKSSEKTYDVRPGQSIELLQELHILTRDGKLNQDSRRKLKQVFHLYQFIEPLLAEVAEARGSATVVDHGAGKSYLGFLLYDLFFKDRRDDSRIYGVEAREELVASSRELAERLGFERMTFLAQTVADAASSEAIPADVDVVTALHACDTATDDALRFAIERRARHVVLVPCCQAEVAAALRQRKADALARTAVAELWRHPIHTREFGSHVTNVLRSLQLEAHGYRVTVTELVGWEHSLKNELILATRGGPRRAAQAAASRLSELRDALGLTELAGRFFTPQPT